MRRFDRRTLKVLQAGSLARGGFERRYDVLFELVGLIGQDVLRLVEPRV